MRTHALLIVLALTAGPLLAQEPDGTRPEPAVASFDPTGLEARSDSFAMFVNGSPIGGQRLVLERLADGWRFTERTEIGGRMEQRTSVVLDERLAPVSVRQVGSAMGDSMGIRVDYAGGRAVGTARTPSPQGVFEEAEIDAEVSDGVVDDNTLQVLLPTLEWSMDATHRLPVFSSGIGETRQTVLRVTGIEEVEVPAGVFEAYRVEADRENAPVAFWITTGEPRRVVKVASLGTPFEAVLVE